MIEKFIPRLKKRDLLIFLLLTIVYFLVTSYNLTSFPIFVDEAIYSRWSQVAMLDAQWRFISLTDGKQPLFMWVAMPFIKYLSDPLFATRFVSVLSGYFTLLGMWYAGWLISGGKKKTAYISALLSMISPYLFFYNRFAVVEAMLVAFGIWIFNLSFLLTKTRRLDIALILGGFTGMGLLVKSPALFYMLLIPVTYLLVLKKNKLFSRKTKNYGILVGISWVIAEGFNYIQRLSPWMYRIAQKNEFFLVPFSEIFKEPKRIIFHFQLALKWYSHYQTIPLFLVGIAGIYIMFKKKKELALVMSAWFFGPLIGEALIARLFAPRYITFVAQFFLLFAAYALSQLKGKRLKLMFLLISIIPSIYIYKSLFTPLDYPFADEDGAYINGWSSGQGVKEIAAYLEQVAADSNKPVYVGTEGTFGLLPHALELYTEGNKNLEIVGFWPVSKTPPQEVYEAAETKETYFIYNNTVLDSPPEGTELVLEYPKKTDEFWIRLYKVNPLLDEK